jgi:hypothetical protein
VSKNHANHAMSLWISDTAFVWYTKGLEFMSLNRFAKLWISDSAFVWYHKGLEFKPIEFKRVKIMPCSLPHWV